jgi:ABC-type Na+ transport system ATPase subunit NatA
MSENKNKREMFLFNYWWEGQRNLYKNFLKNRGFTEDECEDMLQESGLKFFRQIQNGNNIRDYKKYAFQIVRSNIFDFLSKRYNHSSNQKNATEDQNLVQDEDVIINDRVYALVEDFDIIDIFSNIEEFVCKSHIKNCVSQLNSTNQLIFFATIDIEDIEFYCDPINLHLKITRLIEESRNEDQNKASKMASIIIENRSHDKVVAKTLNIELSYLLVLKSQMKNRLRDIYKRTDYRM